MTQYSEIRPASALSQWVECYWVIEGPVGPFDVLPDGCVDFLFECGDRPRAMLVGTMTRPLSVPALPNASMVAVRFHPGAARAFVRADFADFTDGGAFLGELGPSYRELQNVVLDAGSKAARLGAIERWLLSRLPARADVMEVALATLRARGGSLRIDELAAEVGISRQWLGRQVRERTGLSPKLLARILRLRAVERDAQNGGSLAAVAGRHGFADQAHLARDVRAIHGRTTTAWLGRGFHSSKTATVTAGTLGA